MIGWRSCWAAGGAEASALASTPLPWPGSLMSWSGDDSDPVGRSGVAGDRAHGSAQRVRQPVAAGSGGAAAGSVGWPPVLLSRPPRRSVEGYLARRPGRVPVHEEAGTGPLFVAERSRRRGDDLAGPARLSFVGDRLASSPGNLASNLGRMTIPLAGTGGCDSILW